MDVEGLRTRSNELGARREEQECVTAELETANSVAFSLEQRRRTLISEVDSISELSSAHPRIVTDIVLHSEHNEETGEQTKLTATLTPDRSSTLFERGRQAIIGFSIDFGELVVADDRPPQLTALGTENSWLEITPEAQCFNWLFGRDNKRHTKVLTPMIDRPTYQDLDVYWRDYIEPWQNKIQDLEKSIQMIVAAHEDEQLNPWVKSAQATLKARKELE